MKNSSFIFRCTLLLRLTFRMSRANRPEGCYFRRVPEKAGNIFNDALDLDDGSLPPLFFKKIRWYMVELLETGKLLSVLQRKSLSGAEERNFVLLGAIMAVFDSLIDDAADTALASAVLRRFIRKETAFSGSENMPAIERIFILFSDQLFVSVSDEQWQRMSVHFEKISYQLKSGEQKQKILNEEETLNLTFGKGGASVLLCYSLLFPPDEKAEKAMFELGGLIQLLNDAQDIRKDAEKGIRTFVWYQRNFSDITKLIESYRKKTFLSFSASGFPERSLYRFLFCINALVVAIHYKTYRYTEICNDQIDIPGIALRKKSEFAVNPFSLRGIKYIVPRVIRFKNIIPQAT